VAEKPLEKRDDFMKTFGIKTSDLRNLDDHGQGWFGMVVSRKKEKNDGQ
jgi:hypothetical protein